MNKQQLAEELGNKVAGISRAQAEKMLDLMTRIITEKLRAGEDVIFAGFGAFSSRKRKGRIGVNPRNVNEKIEIPDTLVAKFKPGKNLKDSLKRAGQMPKEYYNEEEMGPREDSMPRDLEPSESSEEAVESTLTEPTEPETPEKKPENPQF